MYNSYYQNLNLHIVTTMVTLHSTPVQKINWSFIGYHYRTFRATGMFPTRKVFSQKLMEFLVNRGDHMLTLETIHSFFLCAELKLQRERNTKKYVNDELDSKNFSNTVKYYKNLQVREYIITKSSTSFKDEVKNLKRTSNNGQKLSLRDKELKDEDKSETSTLRQVPIAPTGWSGEDEVQLELEALEAESEIKCFEKMAVLKEAVKRAREASESQEPTSKKIRIEEDISEDLRENDDDDVVTLKTITFKPCDIEENLVSPTAQTENPLDIEENSFSSTAQDENPLDIKDNSVSFAAQTENTLVIEENSTSFTAQIETPLDIEENLVVVPIESSEEETFDALATSLEILSKTDNEESVATSTANSSDTLEDFPEDTSRLEETSPKPSNSENEIIYSNPSEPQDSDISEEPIETLTLEIPPKEISDLLTPAETQPAVESSNTAMKRTKKIDRSWINKAIQPLKTEPVKRKRIVIEPNPLPNKTINLSAIKRSKYSSPEDQKKANTSEKPRVVFDLDDAPKPPRNHVVYDLPKSPKPAPKIKPKKNKNQKKYKKKLYI